MSRNGKARRTDTHCGNGHPWTDETRHVRPDGKTVECRICCRDREKGRRAKAKVARAAKRLREGARPIKAQKLAASDWWDRLLASPDREYKQAMLESKAEMDAWDARQEATKATRQKRGIIGQPAPKRKRAEVAA